MVLGEEVLLGAIPMEDMDLVIQPASLKITVNSESPNIPMSVAKFSMLPDKFFIDLWHKYTHMHITPPANQNFGFFNNYIYKVVDTDLITALERNWAELKAFAQTLTPEQLDFRYAEGKWTIKEVLQHLADAERTFAYRILRVSRNDQAQVPPYSPDGFVANSWVNDRSLANIMQELDLLRKATIVSFSEMPEAVLERTGPGRDAPVSVRALGFAVLGHATHHLQVLKEKYLPGAGL